MDAIFDPHDTRGWDFDLAEEYRLEPLSDFEKATARANRLEAIKLYRARVGGCTYRAKVAVDAFLAGRKAALDRRGLAAAYLAHATDILTSSPDPLERGVGVCVESIRGFLSSDQPKESTIPADFDLPGG